jgi:hypothetical protein
MEELLPELPKLGVAGVGVAAPPAPIVISTDAIPGKVIPEEALKGEGP